MKRDIDDSLVADHGDLGRCAVLHDIEEGHDRGGREIDMTHLVAGLVEHVAEGIGTSSRFGRSRAYSCSAPSRWFCRGE